MHVQSSVIEDITYTLFDQKLIITFKQGTAYAYLQVPSFMYTSLLNSSSKGRLLNSHIKNNFTAQRLPQENHES
jgi:hypothetical protein